MFVPNHKHILLQGYISYAPKKEEEINEWLKNLVKRVRMQVIAGPVSKYVDEPGNEGLTGVIGLATSHAAIHIWDKNNPAFFQFDLYSCTDFSPKEVFDYFNETFGLLSYKYVYYNRNNFDFKIEESN